MTTYAHLVYINAISFQLVTRSATILLSGLMVHGLNMRLSAKIAPVVKKRFSECLQASKIPKTLKQ